MADTDNNKLLSNASNYIKSVLSYENPDDTRVTSIDYDSTPVRLTLHQLDTNNEIPLFDSRVLTREIKIKDYNGDFYTINNYNQNLNEPLEITLPSTISNEASNTIIAEQGQRLLYSSGDFTKETEVIDDSTEKTYHIRSIKESNFKIEDNNALSFFREADSTIGDYSLAWGGNEAEATAEGDYSFAFGPNAVAKSATSVTSGSPGFSNIAFGNTARALGKNNSIAIGNQTIAASLDESLEAGQSLAMGFKAAALGNFSTCIGFGEQPKYFIHSVATYSNDSMKFRLYLKAKSADLNPIFGMNDDLVGYKILYFPQLNIYGNIEEIDAGNSELYNNVLYIDISFKDDADKNKFTNRDTGNSTEILLLRHAALGTNSITIGAENIAIERNTIALGSANTVIGSDLIGGAIAIGLFLQAIGENSIGIGMNSLTPKAQIGDESISIGCFNNINLNSNNILIGSYLQSSSNNQIILGKNNGLLNDTDRFAIGAGMAGNSNRKNLLTVSNRGYTSIGYGELNTYYEVKGALKTTVNSSSITPITIGLGTGENYMGLYYGVGFSGIEPKDYETPSTWAERDWILQFDPRGGSIVRNRPRGLVSFGPRDVQVNNNLTVNKDVQVNNNLTTKELNIDDYLMVGDPGNNSLSSSAEIAGYLTVDSILYAKQLLKIGDPQNNHLTISPSVTSSEIQISYNVGSSSNREICFIGSNHTYITTPLEIQLDTQPFKISSNDSRLGNINIIPNPQNEQIQVRYNSTPFLSCSSSEIILSNVTVSTTSDQSLKTNVQNINNNYDIFYDTIIPKTFTLIEKNNITHFGFIAQNVEEAYNLINESYQDQKIIWKDENNKFLMNYIEFIPLNTWQIQKLKSRVSSLEQEIQELKQLLHQGVNN